MTLLLWPFGGLFLGGLRDPWLACAASAALWLWAAGRRVSRPVAAAWAPLACWLALSTARSDQPWASLPADSRWLTLGLFAALAGGSRHWKAETWAKLAVLAAVAAAAAGLVTGWPALSRSGGGEGMWGLLPPYYNYAAFVVEAGTAAATAALLSGKAPRADRRSFAAAAVFGVCWLAAARSRGAWIALTTAVIAAAALQKRLNPRRALLGACGALALGAALALAGAGRFALKLDHSAAFKRPQIWRAAVQAAADRPILGWGPGNFAEAFHRHNFPSGMGVTNYQFSTAYAHGEVLQILAELGLAGPLWLGLALLASSPRPPFSDSWAAQGALAAGLAMALHCAVDNFLHVPALGMMLLCALACARGPDAEAVKLPRWAAAMGLAVVVAAPWPRFLSERWAAQASHALDEGSRIALLRRRAALFPAEAGLWEDLARAELEARRPADAAADLSRAEALDPTNGLYPEWRGERLAAQGRWREAEAAARRSLLVEPNELGARLLLAEALSAEGRRAAAAAELSEAERRRRAVQSAFAAGGSFYGYDRAVTAFDPARFARLARAIGLRAH